MHSLARPATIDPAPINISIRAVPNGRRAQVVGRYGEAWKVRITAAPEKGRANAELVRLLSEVLNVPRADIAVTRGASSRDKAVTITGLDAATADARMADAAAAL